MDIKIGTLNEICKTVSEEMLAKSVGSGDVDVLATPVMLALMEQASAKCLSGFLTDEQTSVGINISSTHLCATPLSMKVKAISKITGVNDKQVTFDIKAYDEVGLIGEGTHTRFILNREKFEQKANDKLVK